MFQGIPKRWRRAQVITAALALAAATSPLSAHEPEQLLDVPGFRPDSPQAAAFVEALDTATIAVYPTLVRRADRTAVSYRSQAEAIEQLEAAGISAIRRNKRIDLGRILHASQWEIFQADMPRIADVVRRGQTEARYHLVLEFLLPVSDDWIFGIECYVLDAAGNNAMSFLLNSHHRAFAEAGLATEDETEAERVAMVSRATAAAVRALLANIELQRDKMSRLAAFADRQFETVVFDDFETSVPTTVTGDGVAVGYVTFSDGVSSVEFSATAAYPPLSEAAAGNRVLRLDMDVQNWSGFAHFFLYEDDETALWVPYDWRGFEGISFRLYGHGSGTGFFVDIIDNRRPDIAGDTAERYVFYFADDVAGWRRVVIPFEAFVRKETGNGAPNDGLGLDAVHGWAIGTTATDGPVTFYLDDFSLLRPESSPPSTAAGYPVNEVPMYGLHEKTEQQRRADEAYIRMMTAGGRSREAAAEVAAKNAWNVFYTGDKAQAIRRFNQAWLLDPDNALALWGFAVTSIDRGDWEAALRYYRMAMESDPENPRLERDYQLALRQIEKLGT
ncbi:carbohydrate binding domain-containing protein [Lentisalinibacter salinarum]|uniref:carbohydrate binding domain-containing protein n=1 Tax=Lentisalinibacter salinarum TaxID=2992239 RepID=UPI00386BCB30